MSAINFLNFHFERRVWFKVCVSFMKKNWVKKRNRLFLIFSQTKRFKHDSFSRKKSKMNYFSHNILFQIPEIFFNVRVFSNLWLVNVFVSYITNKANVFLRKKSFCGQNPWKKLGILEADKNIFFPIEPLQIPLYSLDFLGCGPFDLNSSIHGREILKKFHILFN